MKTMQYIKKYDENGIVRWEGNRDEEGKYQGLVIERTPEGVIQQKATYKDGFLSGRRERFNIDGSIANVNNFAVVETVNNDGKTTKESVLHGYQVDYSLYGSIQKADYYINGQCRIADLVENCQNLPEDLYQEIRNPARAMTDKELVGFRFNQIAQCNSR